ncbi:MAG TPA: YsnF/AvaK domain-containing protein [Anaeromyxobacteraceae bacterium]|nr:YsnF/AvaK domain-containing protein [Anaeromyxobacteraceae bacterium]
MVDRNQVREGMTVYSSDGEKLGKVLTCDQSTFVIEKGFFFPKDYIARYDHVAEAQGDEIHLSLTKDAFRNNEGQMGDVGDIAGREHQREPGWSGAGGFSADDRAAGLAAAEGSDARMREGPSDAARAAMAREDRQSAGTDDIRVPVVEEELEAVKRDKQAGEVRLRKDVVQETKRIDVPVTREEVKVERVPGSGASAASTEGAFEEKSVSMPVREEEVEIRKRPVVKEEVRLRKERHVEQRAAEGDVRREQVHVEGEGASGEDIRRHVQGGEDPGTIGNRRDDPDLDR